METGSRQPKAAAIFITHKVLLDEYGLRYICHDKNRMSIASGALNSMVNHLAETQVDERMEPQTIGLLRHVVRCYLRLSDNPKSDHTCTYCNVHAAHILPEHANISATIYPIFSKTIRSRHFSTFVRRSTVYSRLIDAQKDDTTKRRLSVLLSKLTNF